MSARSTAFALVGVCTFAVVGCGGGSSQPASTTTTTTSASSAITTSTTGGSASTATSVVGCPSGGQAAPAGAGAGAVPDVDHDGRRDQAWVSVDDDGTTTVGIQTAAGGGDVHEWDSASPVTRQVLVVDADEEPPVEILADDGRSVELWAFSDCRIQPVTNPQGDTYTFSLGFTETGTGVGCVDVNGQQQLVGLDVRRDDGATADWARTVVHLDDLSARNGETTTGSFQRPEDAEAIDLLHRVTCGERTMADDGITAPR